MKMVDVKAAAEMLDITGRGVRLLIKQGKLNAQRFGRTWAVIIDKKFKNYVKSPSGRPRKT